MGIPFIVRIAKAFGTCPEFWIDLQNRFLEKNISKRNKNIAMIKRLKGRPDEQAVNFRKFNNR